MKLDQPVHKKAVMAFVLACLLSCLMVLAACQQPSEPASDEKQSEAQAQDTEAKPDEKSEDAESTAAAFDFSMTADCGMCHTTELSSETDSAFLCSTHAAQGMTCTTCHSDEAELSKAHDGVKVGDKTPKKAKATSVPDSYCLTCHDDYPVLAEKTADSTALTDANGTTVNPHLAPTLTEGHADQFSCASCHKMHKEADYQTVCKSCHHMDVYECGTCHEAK